MHRAFRRVLWAGIFVGLWGFPAGAETVEGQGEKLYHQYCGACHGTEADGKGAVSSALDPAPPDLRRIAERRDGAFPDAQIIEMIDGRHAIPAHGTRDMPVWGKRLVEGQPETPDKQGQIRGQILSIVAYLKSIQVGME